MNSGDVHIDRAAPGRFDSRLIQKPQQQPRLRRTAWGLLTLAFWGFYFYLWAPLATVLSWLLGARVAWLQLYHYQQQLDTFIAIALPVILVCCAVLLIGWAEYNRRRFTGKERRSARADAPRAQVAHGLGAGPALARQLAGAKIATLQMDEHARPVAITTPPPCAPAHG